MPTDNLIEMIVEFVEREAYTDIFIRPGHETRIKTPIGWVLVSDLAKGSRPAPIDRNMLEQLIGTLTGDGEWLSKMKASRQSLAFMMPLDRRRARLRFKVALCAPGASAAHGDVPSDFTVNIRKLPATIPTIQATGLPQSVTSMLTLDAMSKLPDDVRQRLQAVAGADSQGCLEAGVVPFNEEIRECSLFLRQLVQVSLNNPGGACLYPDWRCLPILP